jgi:hypothetical protein
VSGGKRVKHTKTGSVFSSLLFKPLLLHRILYFTVTLTELIMLSSLAFSLPLLLAGLQATAVGASPSISAVGSKFFYENGTQFYIKGT